MNISEWGTLLQELIDAEGGSFAFVITLIESIVVLLLIGLLQHFVYRLVNRNVLEVERRHQLRIWVRVSTFFLMIGAVVALWLPSGRTLVQVLALLAAGLALTLSRPISSLLAWGVIMVRAPFRVGDRIQAGEVAGDVVDIGLLHIHLLEIGNWVDGDQSTGRIVHLPNTVIFEEALFNYTEGFDLVWNELDVVLTHDSDWEAARELLLREAEPIYTSIRQQAISAADRMASRYAYQRGITTPYVYVKLLRDGIKLSLRYLCPPRRRRGTAHDITRAFLLALRDAPTIRLAAPGYHVTLAPPAPRDE